MPPIKPPLTLQNLRIAAPTIRWQNNYAVLLARSKSLQLSKLNNRHGTFFESVFEDFRSGVNLDIEATFEAKKRNIEKVERMFATMKQKLDEQQKRVIEEMESMNPDEQEIYINFIDIAQDFFFKALDFLRELFVEILEKIREGFVLAEGVFRGIINLLNDNYNEAF